MRLFGRRYTERDVASGSDAVIIAYPIPPGATLKNVWFNVHLVGAEGVEFARAVSYGMSAFVTPVLDPDAQVSFTTLWDTSIPKDIDEGAGVFDLDTAGVDATPEFEMGEPDWTGVFDMASHDPIQIYRRRKFMTVANGMANYEAVSAATDVWTPADFISGKISRNVHVNTPSAFMLGVSSPSLDRTTTTDPVTPTEQQWTLMKYLDVTLEQAFINLIGLTEAGAESPWEDASAFIANLIEAPAFEEDAAAYHPISWRCFANATIEVSIPNSRKRQVLTSEG